MDKGQWQRDSVFFIKFDSHVYTTGNHVDISLRRVTPMYTMGTIDRLLYTLYILWKCYRHEILKTIVY